MKNCKTFVCQLLVLGIVLGNSLNSQTLVALRNTPIKAEPHRKSQVLVHIPKGTLLKVLAVEGKTDNNYFYVRSPAGDQEGWVIKSAVVEVIEKLPVSSDGGYRYADVFGTGQVPAGYYDAAQGLSGDSLKKSLHRIIRDHRTFSYEEVYSILEMTDRDPDDSLNVVLLYTGRSVGRLQKDRGGRYGYAKYGYTYEDAWNREHVWPKSFGFPDEQDTAYTDLHHIRPADRTINTERNTRSFGYGTIPYFDNGNTVETGCRTSPEWVWEPPDFVKGDIARMVFYMAVRYEGYQNEGDLELIDSIAPRGSGQPRLGVLPALLEWHELDPVDNWERRRNDIIFRRFQGNRNPFIDHPEFVQLIWGAGH